MGMLKDIIKSFLLGFCFLYSHEAYSTSTQSQNFDLSASLYKLVNDDINDGLFDKNQIPLEILNILPSIKIPQGDLPDEKTLAELEDQDPTKFYYGYNSKPDYKKARLVAYSSLLKMLKSGNATVENEAFLNAISVLMMLYVNGQDVQRNFDIAILFSLLIPDDFYTRINKIKGYRASQWRGDDFRFCDDVSNGYMAGYCAGINQEVEKRKENEFFDDLTKSFDQENLKKLDLLKKAAYSYFEKRIQEEISVIGIMRASFPIDKEVEYKESFRKTLTDYENNTYKKYSKDDFNKFDQNLNQIYKNLMSKLSKEKKDLVRKAQRDWIKYRDAFNDFVTKKYPNVSSNDVKTFLTDLRTKELENLIHETGF